LKTIKISDNAHRELTRLLGEMMSKTGKPKTYGDVIDALTMHSVIIPTELLDKIDVSISANKKLDYATRTEFVEAAIRDLLQTLSGKYN
jgi:hypothetical protein